MVIGLVKGLHRQWVIMKWCEVFVNIVMLRSVRSLCVLLSDVLYSLY